MDQSSPGPWVVYTTIGMMGARIVCTQQTWERMIGTGTCFHILIRDNISSREEAERLALSSDRDEPPSSSSLHRTSDEIPLWRPQS